MVPPLPETERDLNWMTQSDFDVFNKHMAKRAALHAERMASRGAAATEKAVDTSKEEEQPAKHSSGS
ncbi:MAG TPA: hypothetical protein VMV93_09615 [Chloroflexota bacterium]|nr:hypothetical protein [Chloroflexota bacterium]